MIISRKSYTCILITWGQFVDHSLKELKLISAILQKILIPRAWYPQPTTMTLSVQTWYAFPLLFLNLNSENMVSTPLYNGMSTEHFDSSAISKWSDILPSTMRNVPETLDLLPSHWPDYHTHGIYSTPRNHIHRYHHNFSSLQELENLEPGSLYFKGLLEYTTQM